MQDARATHLRGDTLPWWSAACETGIGCIPGRLLAEASGACNGRRALALGRRDGPGQQAGALAGRRGRRRLRLLLRGVALLGALALRARQVVPACLAAAAAPGPVPCSWPLLNLQDQLRL